jgi:Transcriptional regulatory protein, C terminal
MTDSAVPTLAIGIANSPDGRRRLAQLLGGAEAFLIVSNVDQARQFLDGVAPTSLGAVPGPPDGVDDPVPPGVADELPAGLRVDSDRRLLCWRNREVALTPLEHDFLRCLTGMPGRVWTYEKLHLEVWGNAHVGRGSDIHSTVRRVRGKLARIGAAVTIDAIRGVGIRLVSA